MSNRKQMEDEEIKALIERRRAEAEAEAIANAPPLSPEEAKKRAESEENLHSRRSVCGVMPMNV
jgi:hypothetical protein